MRGFIVDETYRIEDGKATIYLFGRLENGESFCTIHTTRPFFSIRTADVAKAKRVRLAAPVEFEDSSLVSMQGDPVTRVTTDIPKDVPIIRKAFEDHKIPCFEADVRFTQRFLMDRDVLRTMKIVGDHEPGQMVDRVYREPEIGPAAFTPELKLLSFDIECSMDLKQLYSVSIVCGDRKEVLIIHDGELRHARAFPDERSLLVALRDTIIELDPDILTGWNTIDFDLKVLRDKFVQHQIPFRFGRWDWECTLRIESSFLKESTAEVPGRQVLDGIQMLKLNFISLENYKLATAAKELLGEEKLIGEQGKGDAIEAAYRKDPQKLVDYNLKDSVLVLDILAKTNAVEIMCNRALLTGMPLDRVRGSIASFEGLYLRELHARGIVAPSGAFAEKEEDIGGGFVMESRPGIYDNIIVLDFKSLYPSIMRTFNIDPLAFARGKDDPRAIEAPNGVRFAREEGILPELLTRLWTARDAAKKRKDERASFAIKILMNSFFGVLASPACRFFSMDMANAITAFGRHFIQLTADQVRAMGHQVIYGDTDSVFIDGGCASVEDAERLGARIAKEINAFYDAHIKEHYGRASFMELERDKVFKHFLMPRVRGSEEGAKKRYAGIVMEGGKETLQATGLELVRRDWTDLAKEFQGRLLELVFAKEDPRAYTKEFVQQLKAGKLDGKLVYRKAIRKELDEYTKTTPPHIKAARILQEMGRALDGNIMEYLMTDKGPYPAELMREDGHPRIDYEHYIEKQLAPIADAILCFYDTTFEDLLKGRSQKTLFGY